MAGRMVADLLMAVAVLSLLWIVIFFALGAIASVVAVVGAERRRHRRYRQLAGLAVGCSVAELAGIDERLERALAAEPGAAPRSWRG